MDPGYADGRVNVARARIQEGNVAAADRDAAQSARSRPEAGQDAFLPRHRAEDARPLRRSADASAGRRRAVSARPRRAQPDWPRAVPASAQFSDAIDEFKAALSIDPEDLQAHYNLMLCYQGLGDAGVGRARADALHALQGRRVRAGDHRPLPAAASPTTTTSASRSTSTALSCAIAHADVRCPGPSAGETRTAARGRRRADDQTEAVVSMIRDDALTRVRQVAPLLELVSKPAGGSCPRTAPPGARRKTLVTGDGLRARRGAPFAATRERF